MFALTHARGVFSEHVHLPCMAGFAHQQFTIEDLKRFFDTTNCQD